jgi:hypothetical protein
MERHNANMTDDTARAWRVYANGACIGVTDRYTARDMQDAIARAKRSCTLMVEPVTGYGICRIGIR